MTFIDSWDSGQPGATWDSGLQWDVNVGPNLGSTAAWLALITSEHNQRPKFMLMLATLLQPIADTIAVTGTISDKFDLDLAAGAQLDVIGQWVGITRNLSVPITGVYFSFDTASLGFDQGTWQGPFNPLNELVTLDDAPYRTLLRAKIANNQWDGTIAGAYAAWAILFAGTGITILIQDLGFMHMLFALKGSSLDAVTVALFKGGYLNMKPAGVRIDYFVTESVADVPFFGFDAENASVSGFDVGAFGALSPGV